MAMMGRFKNPKSCMRERGVSWQLEEEAEAIRAFIVQIMREPANAPGDVMGRLYAAFPGREELVRQVVNAFLASNRFDLPTFIGKLYSSALVPLVAGAEHDPSQLRILACPDALVRYTLDFFGEHRLNHRVDRERLLNQLAHCIRTGSAELQALYRQTRETMLRHRFVVSRSHVHNRSQVGVQMMGGASEQVVGGTGGGTFTTVTGGAPTNASNGPAIPTGGGSGRVPQAIAEAGAESKGQEAGSAEIVELLRKLSVKMDDVSDSLKRKQEKMDAQMDEFSKRVRSVEENHAERGLELGRLQTHVNQNTAQLNNLQGQLQGLATLMGGMLGGARAQGAMGGGGGPGPVGGILGYGGGGGMLRGPSTSRLNRPLAVKSASAPSTPAKSSSRKSPATTPSTRATRSRTRASTGAAGGQVDLTLSDTEDEEEEEREQEAATSTQSDEVDSGAQEKDANGGGASETKGSK